MSAGRSGAMEVWSSSRRFFAIETKLQSAGTKACGPLGKVQELWLAAGTTNLLYYRGTSVDSNLNFLRILGSSRVLTRCIYCDDYPGTDHEQMRIRQHVVSCRGADREKGQIG